MASTKHHQMTIKNEYRIIHESLHSGHDKFMLGRKEYYIEVDSEGRRYVDYDNIRFVRQEKNTTMYGRKAHYREKITWCVPHDPKVPVFVIDAHALIQPVNNAVIGVDINKLKEAASGTTVDQPGKAVKAKRGRKKLGE